MNLHEWGDEKDCFTKEDLTTLCVFISLYFYNHSSILLTKRAQETYNESY